MASIILLTMLLLLQDAVGFVLPNDYLKMCCDLGGSWAEQRMSCKDFVGPVLDLELGEQPACLESVETCCRKAYQEEACIRGRIDARTGAACESPDNPDEYRRNCCEGCKLGILTGSSGKDCAPKKFSRDVLWEWIFIKCCNEAISTTTRSSSNATIITDRSPATRDFMEATLKSEDIDNGIDKKVDLVSSIYFKSDNECLLLSGMPCSQICVRISGSYYCQCYKGFILEEDGRSCKLNNTMDEEQNTTIVNNPSVLSITSTSFFHRNFSSTTPKPLIFDSTLPLNLTASSDMLTSMKSTFSNVSSSIKSIELSLNTSIARASLFPSKLSTFATEIKSKWAIPSADAFKIFAIDAKLRTTRSLPIEDNELNLPCPTGYRFTLSTETCDDIDECADGTHNCGKQKCYNLPGSFQCAKAPLPIIRRKPGFSSTAAIGSIRDDNCDIGTRYDVIRGGCVDVNECEEIDDACSSNEECRNTPGSFHCVCILGFRRDELTQACVDVNECQLENDCLSSQRCDNTIGSYTCVRFLPCGTGYTLNAATEICEDDDECSLGTHDCGSGYSCRNTHGSYRCDRNRIRTTSTQRPTIKRSRRPTVRPTSAAIYSTPRIINTNASTTTIMTSSKPRTLSIQRAIVTTTTTARPMTTVSTTHQHNTTISSTTTPTTATSMPTVLTSNDAITTTTYKNIFTHKPKKIIITTTTTTEDIPTVGTLRTTPYTIKSIIPLRLKIKCLRGFENDPFGQCIDIDECHKNVNICGRQRCINTIGSYRCEIRKICGIGYAADPITSQCKDINECVQGLHKCGPEQTCENRQGGYICYCPAGYEVGGSHNCIDLDECERSLPRRLCDEGGHCVNTLGSYRCECDFGFEEEHQSGGCRDVDECAAEPGPCQQECYNTWGSYSCGCGPGYQLRPDNRTCEDIDECSEFKNTSLCVGICDNTPGSYVCRCPDGYRLTDDGRTCQDIDECATGVVCKKQDEICQNVRGGFRCNKINCPPGYEHDLQRKNRCMPESPFCPIHDQACFQRPAYYTYNYISIVSLFPIPASTGELELFTMRGAYKLFDSTVNFSMAFIGASAPPHVKPATESCFALRKPYPAQAVLVLTQSLEGPQDIELEFSMEVYGPSGNFAGSTSAKIFIVVTQYEF